MSLLVLAAFALLVAMGAAVAVAFAGNRWYFAALGLVLGAIPLVQIPVVDAPLMLLLAAAIWGALLLSPRPPLHLGWPELVVPACVAGAALSALATGGGAVAVVEWGRWTLAALIVIPLRMLAAKDLVLVGKAYVVGAFLAAIAGIVLLRIDPDGLLLTRLHVLGYSATGGNARVVVGSQTSALRLTGTYVDPNVAGLMLAVALVLAFAVFTGWRRLLISLVLIAAILLTLSRSALGTVAAAVVLLMLSRRAGRSARGAAVLGVVVLIIAVVAIGTVRMRLLDSFGPTDTGSVARLSALQDFRSEVAGHWTFGLGWARPEFREGAVAAESNYVANAVLLTVYRAGLVMGVPFALLMVMTVCRGWRVLRSADLPRAAVAAGAIAVCLVAAQLDFPIALFPHALMAFMLLVAFLTHPRWSGPTAAAIDEREASSAPEVMTGVTA